MKKTKVIFLVLFLGLIALVFYFKNLDKNLYQPIPKENSCVSCHVAMKGFSPSHIPSKVSCDACHLGNPNSFDKFEAHNKMVLIPGNLSNASETCAKCHKGIDFRVKNSMMNTMSGIISVDKHVFGENKNLDSLFNIHHLENKSPADNHLRNKCASCHIGNEKSHPNPITEKSRGGGCTACHLNYSDKAKIAHKEYINSDKEKLPNTHPSLSLKITDNHCFGCHSRSGRISTNYEGWHETIFRDTLYKEKNYRVLEDKRVFEKQQADIHHSKGLSCIDCHDSYDVMGDGQKHAHQEDATNISCEDCHVKFLDDITTIKSINFKELNTDEQRIIKLRNIDITSQFIHSNKTNKNIVNLIKEDNKLKLITKNTSKRIVLSKQNQNCSREVHNNVACSTCHTSWAPQCISCHTNFDSKEDGYDLLAKRWNIGKWQEKGDHYFAEFPSLGIVEKAGKRTIKTFSPGMVMHLQQNDTSATSFHRLFAPVSAHTITVKGKSCMDCHNNSVVLGYGRGKLKYTNKKWTFNPDFSTEEDGLPKDAWIAFLTDDTKNKTTRSNARPFNLEEQKRILKVGSCLTCHKEKSKVVQLMLVDYSKALRNRKPECE
jgi:nitrate/TMAO reductase-like tetraheme cytochrome c subunit